VNRLRAEGSGLRAVTPSPQPRTPSLTWLPWIGLGAFAVLWLARWPIFPLALDPYYHLLIARQIVDAGGPIAYEWWEHAPVGRPHLYPPVLHLLLALLLKSGLSPVTVIRLASVVLPVALLVSLYLAMRRLAGPGSALAVLGSALTPFAFHLHCAITLASTLGMIELLWLLIALEEHRPVAAGSLLVLLGYTHLGLPGMALIMVAAYAAVRGAATWKMLARAGWGLLLVLPWWAHLLSARPGMQVTARWENAGIEIMPVLLAAAAAGLWRCWRLKGRFTWLIACWIGFLTLVPRHFYRWLNGEGMLPLLFLAGVGIEWAVHAWGVVRWPSLRLGTPSERRMVAGVCAGIALLLSPTLVRTDAGPSTHPRRPTRFASQSEAKRSMWGESAGGSLPGSPTTLAARPGTPGRAGGAGGTSSPLGEPARLRWQWRWPDAAPWHLAGAPFVVRKERDATFLSPHVERLAALVARQTSSSDILWSNAPYALGLIAALAHRPMSSAMFNEVAASRPFNPIAAARLVVFFKLDRMPGWVSVADLRPYPLTPVAEDEVATLYRQSGVVQSARPPQAMMPLGAAAAGLALLVGLAAWDLGRTRQRGAIPL